VYEGRSGGRKLMKEGRRRGRREGRRDGRNVVREERTS